MKTKLDEIILNKLKEVTAKKKKRDFLSAVKNPKSRNISIIAEIKLKSPSAGILGEEKDIEKRAILYERSGAEAISLVCDKRHFGGDLEFIKRVKSVVSLPILVKDFIVDPYQIYEMKTYGADAILLIAKVLPLVKLVKFIKLAREINLEPVVEIQNKKELDMAVETVTNIIAVNSRDLETFEVDIDKACQLIKTISDKFVSLGFSGVSDRDDVKKYKDAGAEGILVGTNLMKTKDISSFIRILKS